MDKLPFKRILGLCLGLILCISLNAQETMEKKITKYFSATDTEVDIINKFGQVKVETWTQSKVAVEIVITVEAKDQEDAKKIMDGVEIEALEHTGFVEVQTLINDDKGPLKSLVSKTNKNNVTVDYKVSLPHHLKLSIENQFGDVLLSDYVGKLSIDLRHGNIRASELKGPTDIELSYGDARFKYLDDADLDMMHAEVEINKAGELDIRSNTVEWEIEEADYIKIASKRDDFKIERIGQLGGVAKYSDIEIETLVNKLTLQTDYGSLEVDGISPNFERIKVVEKNSEISLLVAGISFTLEAEMSGGEFHIPQSLNYLKVDVTNEKGNERTITGTIGNNKNTESKLIIAGKNGDISLRL